MSERDALTNKLAWLVGSNWRRLHYVPGVNADTWDAWWDVDSVPGYLHRRVTAACGTPIDADLPGIFSRMSRPRCAKCCRAVDIPTGNGAPPNDDSLDGLRRVLDGES